MTPYLIPPEPLAGLGIALTSRAVARRWTLRRFFDEPRPMRTVRALDTGTGVYVLIPGPAPPGTGDPPGRPLRQPP